MQGDERPGGCQEPDPWHHGKGGGGQFRDQRLESGQRARGWEEGAGLQPLSQSRVIVPDKPPTVGQDREPKEGGSGRSMEPGRGSDTRAIWEEDSDGASWEQVWGPPFPRALPRPS